MQFFPHPQIVSPLDKIRIAATLLLLVQVFLRLHPSMVVLRRTNTNSTTARIMLKIGGKATVTKPEKDDDERERWMASFREL